MSIHIMSLVQSDSPGPGAPVDYYCLICRKHTFMFSPYLVRPTEGDYFRIRLCPDFNEHNWQWTKVAWQDVQTRSLEFSIANFSCRRKE